MRGKELTIDERERRVAADERLIAQIRARQLGDLEALDAAQVATGDGSRSLSEWVAARCDVSLDTARALVGTRRRITGRSGLWEGLAAGEVSFDRVEALSRIPEDVGLLEYLDVGGVRREAARRVRISVEDESRSVGDSFLVLQPSLDESWWTLWGGMDGYTGAVVDKTLTELADRLPDLPDGSKGSAGWRKAMALGELCISGDAPPAQLTVFVDTRQAAASNGEAGVVLESGARVGRQVLEAILCDADVEVVGRSGGVGGSGAQEPEAVQAEPAAAVIGKEPGFHAWQAWPGGI